MKTRQQELHEQAKKFNKEHPQVWDMFIDFTFNRIHKGFNNYSVYSIMERIRWETAEGSDGISEFKINNNHSPFYARWFMDAYPEHNGFFRTRIQKSSQMPANGMEITPSMVQ